MDTRYNIEYRIYIRSISNIKTTITQIVNSVTKIIEVNIIHRANHICYKMIATNNITCTETLDVYIIYVGKSTSRQILLFL